MASPLRWFRRNQKLMLIFFGVTLMIVFLLPQLFDTSGYPAGGENSENTTVANINGAPVTNQEMGETQFQHIRAYQILAKMQENAYRQAIDEGNFRQLPPIYDPVQTGNLSPQNVNRVFMRRKLLAKEGHEMGIYVSDEAVIDYISHITGNRLKTYVDVDTAVRQITNSKLDFMKIKPQIKEDLMFLRTQELAQVGLPLIPNMTRAWALFKKLNYRIQCDVLPISIEDEVAKITAMPSNSELTKIYDDGKYELRDISNEKPGFKQGPKVAIGYFEADFAAFLKKAENDVTPEQIDAEYQRLVDIKSDVVVIKPEINNDNLGLDMGNDELEPNDENNPEESNDDGPPKVPNDETGKKKSTDDDSENKKTDGKSDEDSGDDDSGDDDSGDDDSGDKDSGDEDSGDEESDGSSQLSVKASFVSLNSNQDQEGETQETEGKSGDAEAQQEETQDSEAKTQVGEAKTQEGEAETQDPATNEADAESAKQDEIKIRPLSEVADRIRTGLAMGDARINLGEAITNAENDLINFKFEDYQTWLDNKDDPAAPKVEAPTLDGQSIADKYGLIHNSTNLIGLPEFVEEEISKKQVSVTYNDQNGSPQSQRGFLASFFLSDFHQTDVYAPKTYSASAPEQPGYSPNQYIVWTTAKADSKIRTLEEAKEDIVKFWKVQLAKENVLKRAKSIAADLGSQSLQEKFPDEAKSTGGFTWYNELTRSFGTVGNVEKAGEDFIETAFSLKENESGVAVNYDNTVAYVIQVTSLDKRSDEQLKDEFYRSFDMMTKMLQFNMDFPSPILSQHQNEIQSLFNEWDEQIADKYKLQWISQ